MQIGKFQDKSEEDKGEKGPDDSAADNEVKAIEDNANSGADGGGEDDDVGDNNNEEAAAAFDLGHQQQQQESSTPTPDARSGTAGSRKLQPASMQPTVMEVRIRIGSVWPGQDMQFRGLTCCLKGFWA